MSQQVCDGCDKTADLTGCIDCFYGGDYCVDCIDDHYHNDYECQCFDDWDDEEDDWNI
jgi:hypothetical protein